MKRFKKTYHSKKYQSNAGVTELVPSNRWGSLEGDRGGVWGGRGTALTKGRGGRRRGEAEVEGGSLPGPLGQLMGVIQVCLPFYSLNLKHMLHEVFCISSIPNENSIKCMTFNRES